MSARFLLAACAAMVLLAVALPAGAQSPPPGEWKQGRLVDVHSDKIFLKPYLTEEIWFDSNVYLNKSDKENDFILVTRPGFDFEYDNAAQGGTLAKLGYYARGLTYFDLTDLNAWEQHVSLSFDQKIDAFKVGVYGKYDQQKTYVDVQAVPLLGYNLFDVGAKVGYDFNAADGELGVCRKMYRYTEDLYEFFDHNEDRVWLGGAYHAWDKTDVLGEFAFGRNAFSDDTHADSTWIEILVGVKGKPTAKIGVTAKVGYRGENYKDSADNNYDGESFSGIILRAAATYDATERTRFALELLREPQPSILADYYTINRVALTAAHYFSARIKGSGGFAYEMVQESGPDGIDYSRLFFNVGAAYDILEWLTAEAKYEYQSKSSDTTSYEYNVNRIMLSLTARF